MSRKKGFYFFKRKYKYIVAIMIAALGSFLAIYGNLEKTNLKDVFKNVNISENKENEKKDYDMSVHFLDVGKADCIYINFKGHNILIDAADKEPMSIVAEYLKKQNIDKFDYIFVSHPHRDHIGQMADVIKEYEINNFVESEVPEEVIPTGYTYEKMLKALKNKKVNTMFLKDGEKFEIDGLKIETLAPISPDKKNINNDSLVLKITYNDVKFLFMGDAEKQEESDILKKGYDVKADVIKIGHHGSRTSSSENFLKKVLPQYAIICVGPDKSNLPKEEILNRIKKFCPNIYRTDLNGNIVVSTNGKDISVDLEKN